MSEVDRQVAIVRARARADLARMRFGNDVDGLLGRFDLDRIKADVMEVAGEQLDLAKKDLLARLRHWPFVVGTAVSVLLLVLAWKPALAVLRQATRLIGPAITIWQLWSSRHDRP